MNNQDILRPMFSYSFLPILALIITIGVLVCFLFEPKKEKPTIIKPELKNLFGIKDRYLQELNKLSQDFINNKITNRKAYQKLSMLIRNFIFEVTQIKVQNYSLQEIKKLNITSLTSLVEEYYNPEFAKESKGAIQDSIAKTKEVIEKWR